MNRIVPILLLVAGTALAVPPKSVIFKKALFNPPRIGMTQWLTGGTTDGLTLPDYIGTFSAPVIGDVQCYDFDGVYDNIRSSETINTDPIKQNLDMTFVFNPANITGNKVIGGLGKDPWGGLGSLIWLSGSNLRLSMEADNDSNSTFHIVSTSTNVSAGVWYTVRVTYDGTTAQVWLGDTLVLTDNTTWSGDLKLSTTQWFTVGSGIDHIHNHTHYPFAGKIAYASIKYGPTYVCQEGSGDIAYDTTSGGNHGIITVSANGLDTFHSSSDGIPSWNRQKGFSGMALLEDNLVNTRGIVSTYKTTQTIDVTIEGVWDSDNVTASLDSAAGVFATDSGYYSTGAVTMRRATAAPYEGLRLSIFPIDQAHFSGIYSTLPVFDDGYHKIQLRVEGNRVRLWVDDVLDVDYTHTNFPTNATYDSKKITVNSVNTSTGNQACKGKLARIKYIDDNYEAEYLAINIDYVTGLWPQQAGGNFTDLQFRRRDASGNITEVAPKSLRIPAREHDELLGALIVNPEFESWTDATTPANWQKIGITSEDSVSQVADGLRFQIKQGNAGRLGASSGFGNIRMIKNHTYRFRVDLVSVTSGKLSLRIDGSNQFLNEGDVDVYDDTFTAANNGTMNIWRGDPSVDTDFTIASIQVWDLGICSPLCGTPDNANAIGGPISSPAGFFDNSSGTSTRQTDTAFTSDPFWSSGGVLINKNAADFALLPNTSATHSSYTPTGRRIKHVLQYDNTQANDLTDLYLEIMK